MDTTSGVRITAAAGTYLTPHLFLKLFWLKKSKQSLHLKFPYHTFVHCKVFLTAAPRRARDLFSVPFSGLPLSRPVWILGLVGLYPANSLIHRRLMLKRTYSQKSKSFNKKTFQYFLFIEHYAQFPGFYSTQA